jgi:hypothetical protein
VADIVFVLDSSGSIRDQNPADGSYDNWQLLLEFMVKMVDKLNVGSNHVRIGAVKFSTEAESVFHLNQYTDKTSLITAIRRIKYMGGHTNTAGGIRIMNNEEFTIGNGDRSNVQNIAIVITDGESTRDVENTIPEAIQARNRGIKIYSVGITKNINEDELRKISSQPQLVNENYFKAADFRSLEKVAVAITSNACDNERLFCGDVNTKERMCFCRFDDECDVRPANGTRCLDVDECTLNNGGCEHYCDNTQGSFRCRCKAGFQLAEDKWSCEDTNECDQQPCGNEACTNTYGSYFCGVPSVAAAAGLVGAEGAATVASGVNMSTVVTAAAMSAIAAVLVSLLVVLVARQVQQWRSSRSTPSGDHSQFNRPARNFSGFGSVSSKLSAMTMSSVDSVQEDA